MWKKSIFVGIFFAIIAYVYKIKFAQPKLKSSIVETKAGKLQGVIGYSRNNKIIHEYLGIPFAKPPLGPLRFEPPQMAEPWEGVRDAMTLGPLCSQIDIITQQKYGEENCLYLNVYVPEKKKPSKMPVMVFIHGGIFMYGGTAFFGGKYFTDEEVILVTIAYRLASFGFLNTGDDVVRGNMGLKDQVMALRWVQENIASFGGDPKQVLLFGESAGSACAHLHMLSNMSKGLFYKVIGQSGTAISPFVLSRHPVEQAKRFGQQLNCPTENSKELVACLKKLDANTIIEVHRETTDLLHKSISIFSPSIEAVEDANSFLTEDPMTLLRNGKVINKVPLTMGINDAEGLILSAGIDNVVEMQYKNYGSRALENSWNKVAPKFLFYENNDTVSRHIRNQYFGKTKQIGVTDNLHKYTIMLSDRSFYWPVSETAVMQSKVSPVYLYYYSHVGEFSFAHFITLFRRKFHYIIEILMDMVVASVNKYVLGRRHHIYDGTCHGDELFIQFNTPVSAEITSLDGENFKMSRDLVKLWADFAKDKPRLEFRGVEWPPVDPQKSPLRYLMIGMSYGIIDEPFSKRIQYWKDNYIF